MEANVTTTMNSINDRKLSSYLVLPNYDTYSITSGLKYSEKYDEIQHLIVYSRPKDTPCYTISDVSIVYVVFICLFQNFNSYKNKLNFR